MNKFDQKIQILSKEVTCRHCKGNGNVYGLLCSFCGGTGKMHVVRFEKTGATQMGENVIEFSGAIGAQNGS